jgi:hypothetical protein
MQDFPTVSRMPGADGLLDADAFEPGEVAGMRSAGWILIATAALGVVGWILRRGSPPLSSAVDLFLGTQMLRLRHNWRAWALVRAWIGIAVGAFICAASVAGGGAAAATLGLGQAAYAGSILALLFGMPTMNRVMVGRIVFAVSLALTLIGIALALTTAAIPR